MASIAKTRTKLVQNQEPFGVKEAFGTSQNGIGKGKYVALQKKEESPSNDQHEDFAKQQIKWPNVVSLTVLHACGLYSLTYTPYWSWKTWMWIIFMWHWAGLGVTAGVHRLWTHRSYKANFPLRMLLMICYTSAGMNSIFDWVRDHRVHHKFTETDADPHNAKRGFFFAHCGWLMMNKHPDVTKRGSEISMEDILKDPICVFEHKYHTIMVIFMTYLIPIAISMWCWDETLTVAITSTLFRSILILNGIWTVNSAAHLFGSHPFNKFISPAENYTVAFMCLGEGWHNFHHVFPWDYRASDLGFLNTTMHFLNFAQYIGWATDLKTASPALVKRVAERYGDGTHPEFATSASEVPEEALGDLSLVDNMPLPPTSHDVN